MRICGHLTDDLSTCTNFQVSTILFSLRGGGNGGTNLEDKLMEWIFTFLTISFLWQKMNFIMYISRAETLE